MLVLSDHQNQVNVHLKSKDESIRLIVKNLGDEEMPLGSITFPYEYFEPCINQNFKQWVTIFDHIDDDEYDGDPGDNDEEEPKILIDYSVTKYISNAEKPREISQKIEKKI